MFKQTFRSLQYTNFRIFFIGQIVSLCGTWMQSVALSWLAYKLTGSAVLLAFSAFASQIPCVVFTPIAGVLADRANRRVILIVIQTISMMQAFVLGILTLTGLITIYHIIPLSFLLGICTAMETPVRHSFYSNLIENVDDRGNAIALNSTMINLTRLVGPAFAGILIPLIGEGVCFIGNAVTYVAIIISLSLIKTIPVDKSIQHKSILNEMRDGGAYVLNNLPIRGLLLLISGVSLTGMPVTVLFPIFAKEIYHGDAGTLGSIMSAFGAGSVIGALLLAHRKTVVGLTKYISLSVYVTSCALLLISIINNFYLVHLFTAFFGFGFITMIAACNTVIQTLVSDAHRGRVMSFYTLAFMGMSPIGSLLLGWMAGKIGVLAATGIAGGATMVFAVLFSVNLPHLRQYMRPVYIEKGILLPEQ